MKKSLVVVACMAALAVLLAVQSAAAQGRLEGVWQYTEFTSPDPNAKPTPSTQPGLLVFTKKYWSMILVTGDRPGLPQKDATDAQKVAAWTPFNSSSGTYEVKGNTYTAKTIVSKDPGGMNPDFFITVEFKIDGNTLITTPKATNAGPINMGSAKLTRLE